MYPEFMSIRHLMVSITWEIVITLNDPNSPLSYPIPLPLPIYVHDPRSGDRDVYSS